MPHSGSEAGLRRVFIRRLSVAARLGIYPQEQQLAQRVFIDLELLVTEGDSAGGIGADRLDRVVDYAAAAELARQEATRGHTALAETLAERIAARLLESDPRIRQVEVTVEKPDILADAAGVGVTVTRCAM
ncbi:dihydroneopterin aldolase [Teichococcus oryzae]|nr:dihydroneopterin aldolase [Pseudoroseomonas oryzae]